MKKIKQGILTVLAMWMLAVAPLQAQKLNWVDRNQLTWDDFAGPMDQNSDFAAVTFWLLSYWYGGVDQNGKIENLQVKAQFEQDKSWVRKGKQEDRLLQHEQLHFDIAELWARKLRKSLKTQRFPTNNYKPAIEIIFNEHLEGCRAMQKQYDKESNHYFNKEKQLYWEGYIADAIAELASYAKD
ncbi:MAG TPA: hypothetical protein DCM08_03490 [Microscillaceae bacterium]|jgi:hypothetical protein|nr:hypothetical protein [Microscillaceae bacterium]